VRFEKRFADGDFEGEFAAALACGLIRLDDAAGAPARLVDAMGFEFGPALEGHLSARRLSSLAAKSAAAAAGRLQAVADAVNRCEGPAASCADPRQNAALARAVSAAREAGCEDTSIADAITLGGAGLTVSAAGALELPAAPPLVGVVERALAEAGHPKAAQAALAAWESGDVSLAFSLADGEALARQAGAPHGCVDAFPFFAGDACDIDGFIACVRLATAALDARAAGDWRAVSLRIDGLAEVLVSRGLAYDSKPGRTLAASIQALGSAAALNASAVQVSAAMDALAAKAAARARINDQFAREIADAPASDRICGTSAAELAFRRSVQPQP
jgi:ribonucleoside-diphosphate reductase alpha chain